MKSGDIVLIRFPHTDLSNGKLRPALVIAVAPGHHADLLLALITSRVYQAVPEFDEIIKHTEDDFSETGLKSRSVVRLGRLATVDSAIINARLGRVSAARLNGIKARLAAWLQAKES
ncbi:MAG: type II toxin-antitoxin system PemK/MazF family toxin [Anaerolineaceae bacterium]|nr:type II toxin-antitoxin system PemK/MazF family toxin [Anaerolineaceae bacterium]